MVEVEARAQQVKGNAPGGLEIPIASRPLEIRAHESLTVLARIVSFLSADAVPKGVRFCDWPFSRIVEITTSEGPIIYVHISAKRSRGEAQQCRVEATGEWESLIVEAAKAVVHVEDGGRVQRIVRVERDIVVCRFARSIARRCSGIAEEIHRTVLRDVVGETSEHGQALAEVVVETRVELMLAAWGLAGSKEVVSVGVEVRGGLGSVGRNTFSRSPRPGRFGSRE